MKILTSIWKCLVSFKDKVVNFFTDGKPNVGPLGKIDVIEFFTFTAMCMVPTKIHPSLALTLRFGLCKVISLVLNKYTSMGTALPNKALVTGIVVSASALLVTAVTIYMFGFALSPTILGAIISITITLVGM